MFLRTKPITLKKNSIMRSLSQPFSILLIALFFISLQGCKTENDIDKDPETKIITNAPGTVSAKIDGDTFVNSGFRSVSIQLSFDENDNTYRIQVEAETENNGFEDRIQFSLWSTDFSSLKVGDTFIAGANLNNGEKVFDGDFYRKGTTEGDDTDIMADSYPGATSTCTITKIDHENRLLSGIFSFEAIGYFDDSIRFSITDGVFTELEY